MLLASWRGGQEFPFLVESIKEQSSGFTAFSVQPSIAHGHCRHCTSVCDMVALHIPENGLFCRDRSICSVCFFLNAFPCVFWACILLGLITALPGMQQTKHFLSFPPFIPHLLSIPMLLLPSSPAGTLITEVYSSWTVAALNAYLFLVIHHVLHLLNSPKCSIRKVSHIFNAFQPRTPSIQLHTPSECV